MLNLIGTEIFHFRPLGTEIIGFKEGWGPKLLSGLRESFKLGLVSSISIYAAIMIITKFQCTLES